MGIIKEIEEIKVMYSDRRFPNFMQKLRY